jgi:hypothetical protein
MSLTATQFFMSALIIGIALFRGTSVYVGLYYETLVGHANYGASKLAADHARSANINASNNVMQMSLMGPRMAVEADNITMLVNAAIACPQIHNPPMIALCAEFKANYPRMLRKLAWVRLKQFVIWESLGKLSTAIDKVAALRAVEQITQATSVIDAAVSIRAEDPAMRGHTWDGDSTKFGCDFSKIDALGSPMPGAAFPVLMHQNLLQGLPQALVAMMPEVLCGKGGGDRPTTAKLSMIPSVAKEANDACDALQSSIGSIGYRLRGSSSSSELSKYLTCQRGHGCSFDRDQCMDDKLQEASAAFFGSVGLPQISSSSASQLGGATHAPGASDWNWSDEMRACTFAKREIDQTIVQVNVVSTMILGMGRARVPKALLEKYEYKTCAKWYFPDKEGQYAGVPHDQQPFVSGWKYAFVGANLEGSNDS